MQLINIGKITKPQALKGDVRAKIVSNQNDLISNDSIIYLDNTEYKVIKITDRNTFVILKLEGVDTIETAEKLINKDIYVEQTKTVLSDDEFLVKDVVGFKVIDENNNFLGNVKDISDFGAGDVYTIKNDKVTFLFVNSRNVILDIDFDNQVVVLDSKILQEIAVY